MTSRTPKITRRTFNTGALAAAATLGAPAIVRAQGARLKVGILVPRSGVQAQLGQAMQRGHDVAVPLLKELGYPDIEWVAGDTETSIDVARSAAERLIGAGCNLLTGCFDSGQTTAVAQVCEQRRTPFMISIAAAPQITEQGYKYVFRNFTRSPTIVQYAFTLQKDLYRAASRTPKSAVLMHVNDTYGTSVVGAIDAMGPKFEMPFKIVEKISYDPAARDLSTEVAKAKASGGELLWVVGRLNDAILLTREMVKQRWEPVGIISSGPGWYEDQYRKSLGKLGDFAFSTVPWYDPAKPLAKKMIAAFKSRFPDVAPDTNLAYAFEASLIIADTYKRAKSTAPDALADAMRKTNLGYDSSVTIGPGVKFDAKGQNDSLGLALVQNRDGLPRVVLPTNAAELKPIFPAPGWQKRGKA
jgi:branched-chain amino acid transport system substrate-binding protein